MLLVQSYGCAGSIPTGIIVALLSLTSCSRNEGKQGAWNEFKYKADEEPGNRIDTITKVIVEDSRVTKSGDKYKIDVYYKVKNLGATRSLFQWENKVLSDADGRKFSPSQGQNLLLQPLEQSELASISYYLPAEANLTGIRWGLTGEKLSDSLRYSVSIDPRPPGL